MRRGLRNLVRHRGLRICLLAIAHSIVFIAVYWMALLLRFDFRPPHHMLELYVHSVGWFVIVKLPIFYMLGHYHGWWRYVAFSDVSSLLRAVAISFVTLALLDHFAFSYQVPRSVLVMDSLLSVLVLGLLRCSFRMLSEHYQFYFVDRRPTALLICSDPKMGLLANQLNSHSNLPYRIVGIIDPTQRTGGSRLGHLRVVDGLAALPQFAATTESSEVLLTSGQLVGSELRSLIGTCDGHGLNLQILPPIGDMFSGASRVPVREVDIADLLRRDPVELDTLKVSEFLTNKVVLVTGAGGSIGSEICRQILKFQPKHLVLLGRGENRIFALNRELQQLDQPTEISTFIGDITVPQRMRQAFEDFQPEIVFHAAAHKHVALMEQNPGEAIRNNVIGTQVVVDLAHEYEVECFVQISTDKVVNPTSVMGATKHLAERYVQASSETSSTRCVVCRFGNVLGSEGSVVPIFKEQIRAGGPITITDDRMKRFFMSIPEASQLVLQAGAMGKGGEIFVLDMGEPVRIVDLARDLIRLSGLGQDSIEIKFTGTRPGEKLFEELYFDEESTLPSEHAKLRTAYHRPFDYSRVVSEVDDLNLLIGADAGTIKSAIMKLIPEYEPTQYGARIPEAATER
ncbi:MAG: polysaccharide biosynthesis protein [Planctomycetaceae bacterium]